MNPEAFTALLGNRRDSGEFLDLRGELETVTVRTKSGQQARSQSGPSSGETAKQGRVVVLVKQGRDFLVIAFNRIGQQGGSA